MEAIGPKIRRQRRRLGFTLDDLAARTGISKPYLSLIETGRVVNPPSDEKLSRLEHTLSFKPGELLTQAHLQRTPKDVRAVLARLMKNGAGAPASVGMSSAMSSSSTALKDPPSKPVNGAGRINDSLDLDAAYLSGVLAEMVDRHRGNIEPVTTHSVPVINKVAAGYPSDFTDLSYPRGVADEYLSCPDVRDGDAFAARIHGDSMSPKYREGDIVVFSPAAPAREGDDCFVRFEDGHTTFKRVFFETGEKGQALIRLQPRNERYRPQTVPREQVSGLYKAVYRYQRLDDDGV